MSYSFHVQAPSKAALIALVAEKLDQAAQVQQCHEHDKKQHLAAAKTLIDLVERDPLRDLSVHMAGSLTGVWSGSDVVRIHGASLSISVGQVDRKGG